MPVHFIDNYPKNNLESIICKVDGTPLYGEIWFYKELLKFNESNFLKEENWYVKHNYNLSTHPSSSKKVEGQIDFLIVSRYGILLVEIKGGGIEVDENDIYYSYDRKEKANRYESQNPFNQVKEYAHSLRNLIDSSPFIYRAVIFPHESGFELKSPQLKGYKYLFFSKKNIDGLESDFAKNRAFYDFMVQLPKESRKNLIQQLDPSLDRNKVDDKAWIKFPRLEIKEIKRLKSELFPIQNTYGFNPDVIRNEIILEENYEILNGLRKNQKVMVQGAPGTGKTVLATKFLADNLLRQQKGIFYCANKLLRSKMEYLIYEEYKLDPNLIEFKIFHKEIKDIDEDIDFIIIDEAQEFFDKGLYEFIEKHNAKLNSPRWLILYDPEQAIIYDFKDIDWYTSFFIQTAFVHYLFDTVWRCAQNKQISEVSALIKNSQFKKVKDDFSSLIAEVISVEEKLSVIKDVVDTALTERAKHLILIHSDLFPSFQKIASDYFKKDLEELTEENVNIKSQKVKYTTSIKFRGLECENITMITNGFNDNTRVQNYVGATRAIYNLRFVIWT